MQRATRTSLITAALVLSIASVASAGMLPVVTLAGVPSEFDQGIPYTLDYSVKAHGVEPMELAATEVRFQGPNGELLSFPGVSTGPGAWTVEVTLPSEGNWNMDVLTGGQVLQSLGTVSVAAISGSAALLASLRIVLPIATLLAAMLLVAQIVSRARLVRHPAPATDVV